MRYTRLYFADEDWDLFHEIAPNGYAERFVVFERSSRRFTHAASRAERDSLDDDGRPLYDSTFGALPTMRIEGLVPPPSYSVEISQAEFEKAWTEARDFLRRPGQNGRRA